MAAGDYSEELGRHFHVIDTYIDAIIQHKKAVLITPNHLLYLTFHNNHIIHLIVDPCQFFRLFGRIILLCGFLRSICKLLLFIKFLIFLYDFFVWVWEFILYVDVFWILSILPLNDRFQAHAVLNIEDLSNAPVRGDVAFAVPLVLAEAADVGAGFFENVCVEDLHEAVVHSVQFYLFKCHDYNHHVV